MFCLSVFEKFLKKFVAVLLFIDIDMCQVYSCFSDSYVTLNCTDLPPPSMSITCDLCPEGLVSDLNSPGCLVEGQCCIGMTLVLT